MRRELPIRKSLKIPTSLNPSQPLITGAATRQSYTGRPSALAQVALAAGLLLGSPAFTQLLPPALYPLDPAPLAMAVGDVNNDGRPDLVVSRLGTELGIQILLQLEDGTFEPSAAFPGEFTRSVDVGDFNNDGLLDVVRGHPDGIQLYVQNGAGELVENQPLPSDERGALVRIGDFNQDGLDDVVSVPDGSDAEVVYIYLQGVTGLEAPITYPLNHGDSSNDVEVGDLNGDGLDDIVVVSPFRPSQDNIAVLYQDPDGGFLDQVLYDAPGNRTYDGVAIGDLNDDGLNDLALAPIGPWVHIFLQNQDGVLEFLDIFNFGSQGLHDSMEIRDFDGDGLNEIVGVSVQQLVVLTSPAHPGGVQVAQAIDLGGGVNFFFNKHHLYCADINGDGLQDAAVANNELGAQVFLGDGTLFADGFEGGDTTSWSVSFP
ncbi:MAG: VCBS repeat-containing protein [Acidobacteriota bacterium]